ncbi:DUF3037 domain-containing protein [Methylomonas sp. LL1]|uniref:DUF3037 domain-containing protein n=1 Tax=Methylomonas sp. LL1 TaxID=2785785 RepID=UPI0018C40F21|nr:DUF3037 domain-containing protein [Methylomonas sp. LL1]QPK62877.1 DUF3037 domain-containing protein [Methylomonas sp. LL1]
MNRQVCKYNIIRFQPFAETQEFANIGVVLFATASKRLEFRLLESRQHKRITDFFDPLNKDVFGYAVKIVRAEIERIQKFYDFGGRVDANLYAELTRCREDIVRFSDSRVLFCDDPIAKVEQLFDHYIQRSFANEPSYEEKMRKQVKELLLSHNLGDVYKSAVIGDAGRYKVTFPFVRKSDHRKAIKPIQFLHDDATALIDHGREWLSKVELLSRFDFIAPEEVLFAYKTKAPSERAEFDPFDEVRKMAEKLGVTMIDMAASDEIVKFANC